MDLPVLWSLFAENKTKAKEIIHRKCVIHIELFKLSNITVCLGLPLNHQ